MKKAMLIFLAAAMLLPLVCCAKPQKTPTETDIPTDAATDSAAASEPPAPTYPDAVPELDFDGAAFRILEQDTAFESSLSIYVEESVGEQLNDAIYDRNHTIEERFRITIPAPVRDTMDNIYTITQNAVRSGDDVYDLVLHAMTSTLTDIANGVVSDWLTVPYIDVSNPWYTDGLEDCIIADKLLFLTGDLSLSYTGATYCLAFNRTKAADYNINEDFYQLVRDGKWTLDRLLSVCVDLYNDVNGSGSRDAGDFYGYFDSGMVNGFVYAADMRTAVLEEDLTVRFDMLSEPNIDLYDKLALLMKMGAGATNTKNAFTEGCALFTSISASALTSDKMVDMSDDFGVLPLPKWNEDQKAYYTNVNNFSALVLMLLKTAARLELIGAVVEAMSALSYRDVLPVYCNSVLELRASRDPESSEMLRLIMNSRVMDFETLYGGGDGWTNRQSHFVERTGAMVSYVTSRLEKFRLIYEDLLNMILDADT